MGHDITGFGLQINLIASNTYPQGVVISQFADDADPFDLPQVTLAETASGLNGDLLSWGKANPLVVTINLIPEGEDDQALSYLTEANRVGKGKYSARDVISILVSYPNGKIRRFGAGKLTAGVIGAGVSSAGRLKTSSYTFNFETFAQS